MARRYVRQITISVGAGVGALALILVCLLVRYEVLERRFRNIYPDNSEARLIEVVGSPTAIKNCADLKIPTDSGADARRCAHVYWYSAYIFQDGWLVPIDDTGTIIQIKRIALP